MDILDEMDPFMSTAVDVPVEAVEVENIEAVDSSDNDIELSSDEEGEGPFEQPLRFFVELGHKEAPLKGIVRDVSGRNYSVEPLASMEVLQANSLVHHKLESALEKVCWDERASALAIRDVVSRDLRGKWENQQEQYGRFNVGRVGVNVSLQGDDTQLALFPVLEKLAGTLSVKESKTVYDGFIIDTRKSTEFESFLSGRGFDLTRENSFPYFAAGHRAPLNDVPFPWPLASQGGMLGALSSCFNCGENHPLRECKIPTENEYVRPNLALRGKYAGTNQRDAWERDDESVEITSMNVHIGSETIRNESSSRVDKHDSPARHSANHLNSEHNPKRHLTIEKVHGQDPPPSKYQQFNSSSSASLFAAPPPPKQPKIITLQNRDRDYRDAHAQQHTPAPQNTTQANNMSRHPPPPAPKTRFVPPPPPMPPK